MKHLKLFESYMEPQYYQINGEEFFNLNKKSTTFEKNSEKWLMEKGFKVVREKIDKQRAINFYNPNLILWTHLKNKHLKVNGVDFSNENPDCVYISQTDDDWFLINVLTYSDELLSDSKFMNRWKNPPPDTRKYYKCDQFEGLLKFLMYFYEIS